MRSSLAVGGLRLKSNKALFADGLRYRCYIPSNRDVLHWRNDAEMSPANSLHTSAEYSKRNERLKHIERSAAVILVCF